MRRSSYTTHHTPNPVYAAGAALCEPPCADFVAGALLCEPPSVDFVAGTALCEPPCFSEDGFGSFSDHARIMLGIVPPL